MNAKPLLLAADLLDKAGDEYSSHGCNDMDLPESFTDADTEALALLMNRSNFSDRPPETWPKRDVTTVAELKRGARDGFTMHALAFGLREMAKKRRLTAR